MLGALLGSFQFIQPTIVLLAMERRAVYIDSCLPFELRSTPKLFNVLADLLEWILLSQGVPVLMHYLDAYLTMGPPNTEVCNQSMQHLIDACAMLGIPHATEKVVGPLATLQFPGIQLDTVHMEARLSAETLSRIDMVIQDRHLKRNATKREILSLVGLLQHATKVVRPGRIFVRCMYSTAAKLQQMGLISPT